MHDKSCSNCKYIKDNECTFKNKHIEGDLTQQGCGEFEINESNTNNLEE